MSSSEKEESNQQHKPALFTHIVKKSLENSNVFYSGARRALDPTKDGILSYGKDEKDKVRSIRTDEDGRIETKHHHLHPWRDKVLIYGADNRSIKRPVEVDKHGRIKVDSVEFISITQEVITTDPCKALRLRQPFVGIFFSEFRNASFC
ncbi:hypothetical protein [Evansella tamaricis]|uniref:Uncharacterized protein n=1 Tax=Evansella tamaricis TaxID=2069301 RepID=A0ABS6JI45_9BACI|nr:hypothetical protein [Evansella tamaricis]MBU9713335.1 hypothetical protein [Evansella tamaricis]